MIFFFLLEANGDVLPKVQVFEFKKGGDLGSGAWCGSGAKKRMKNGSPGHLLRLTDIRPASSRGDCSIL